MPYTGTSRGHTGLIHTKFTIFLEVVLENNIKENARIPAIPARSPMASDTKTEPLMYKILLSMT